MEKKVRKGTSPLEEDYKDTEYNALRRRMSRLRVQQGQLPIADDMDVGAGDEYYNDLVRFWKKHKIYMGKDMMSTIANAKAKKKAKQKGRRKSVEFEDLDMHSSGALALPERLTRRSRFDSESDALPEDSEWIPEKTDSKPKGQNKSESTVKRQTSASGKEPISRSISHTGSPKLNHKGTNGSKSSSPKSSPKILKKALSESAIKHSVKTPAKGVLERKGTHSIKTVK